MKNLFGNIFDIKKFAIHDGPGIRTTVFLKGCPLRCWWCHNPESIRDFGDNDCQNHQFSSFKKLNVNQIIDKLNEDLIFYDESGGGATFSGGEPLAQIEFLEECLKACKLNSINTVVDTSGYAPTESFRKIYQYTDLFLYDFKLFDDDLHSLYTGVSNDLIKTNLKFLDSINANVIVRIPLIPKITDTKENLSKIADFLKKLININYISLLPYNKLAEDKYRRLNEKPRLGNLESQSAQNLEELVDFIGAYGFKISLNG